MGAHHPRRRRSDGDRCPPAPGLAPRHAKCRRRAAVRRLRIKLAAALLVVVPIAAAAWVATHPNPDDRIVNPSTRAALDARRGWRPSLTVLPLIGADQRRRHDRRRTSSWTPNAAPNVTRTSTTSGRDRRITSRRSTTSSTGSRSSTCSRWSAPRRASGARVVTITRCSSTAASSARSPNRSTRPKRRRGWRARRATPSRASTVRWATAGSRSRTRRCITSRRAGSR